MNAWKDTSSHSRDDKMREPNSYTMQTDGLCIIVHRHRDYGDSWVVSCYDLKFQDYYLDSISAETAKQKAIEVIRFKLETLLKEISN